MRPPEPALWKGGGGSGEASAQSNGVAEPQSSQEAAAVRRVDLRPDGSSVDWTAPQPNHAQPRSLPAAAAATAGGGAAGQRPDPSGGGGGGGSRQQRTSAVMVRLPEVELDGSEDENLSDVDDDIVAYLVTDKAEVDAKTKLWLSMNKVSGPRLFPGTFFPMFCL